MRFFKLISKILLIAILASSVNDALASDLTIHCSLQVFSSHGWVESTIVKVDQSRLSSVEIFSNKVSGLKFQVGALGDRVTVFATNEDENMERFLAMSAGNHETALHISIPNSIRDSSLIDCKIQN